MRGLSVYLFSFVLLIQGTLFAQSPISEKALQALNQYSAQELKKSQASQYATQINYQLNDKGQKIRTPYVIVIVHGLFDSPKHIKKLYDFVNSNFQQNTVSLRLSGHFDKVVDMPQATYKQWLRDFLNYEKIFSQLGDQYIFIGHSLGGLLATVYGYELADKTAAVVGVAPAFALRANTKLETRIGALIGYDKWDAATGRRRVAKLGYQVENLITYFSAKMNQRPAVLAHMPALIVDTELDETIVPGAARGFLKSVPGENQRHYYMIKKGHGLKHRPVALSSEFFNLLSSFLESVEEP